MIGLLGGIASGKSRVAAIFEGLGAAVLDADRIAHEALDDGAVRDGVVAAFGPEVLDPATGRVSRPALGRRVFGDPAAVKRLEGLVHPAVHAEMGRRLAGLARPADEPRGVALLDVPLLAETGGTALCEETVFVDASRETRLERAMARGWSAEELARREAHQLPLAEKKARAGFVVSNDGSLDETERQVRIFWQERVLPRL